MAEVAVPYWERFWGGTSFAKETLTAFIGAMGSDAVRTALASGFKNVLNTTADQITPAHVQRLQLYLTGKLSHDDETIITRAKDELHAEGNGQYVLAWTALVNGIGKKKKKNRKHMQRELYRLIVVGTPDDDLTKAKDDANRVKRVKSTILRVGTYDEAEFREELGAMDLRGQDKKYKSLVKFLKRVRTAINKPFKKLNKSANKFRKGGQKFARQWK